MQMRVMQQILTPGVQDGKKADLGPEMLRVCGDRPQRCRGGGKE